MYVNPIHLTSLSIVPQNWYSIIFFALLKQYYNILIRNLCNLTKKYFNVHRKPQWSKRSLRHLVAIYTKQQVFALVFSSLRKCWELEFRFFCTIHTQKIHLNINNQVSTCLSPSTQYSGHAVLGHTQNHISIHLDLKRTNLHENK